jgi:two-component system response regulator YesN
MHFSEHLNEIRILHAKRLLTTTGISISEISESIGYTDQSYFGKVFKKSTGHTPLEYRKRHQQRGNIHE